MKPEAISAKGPFPEPAPRLLGKRTTTRSIVLTYLAIAVITLAVYAQTGSHQFLLYDDDSYVTGNTHISTGLTGGNIIWAFTSVEEANWHPVTWLSHMTDVQLYGMDPRGHHLTSVVIHTISSLLLLCLLTRVSGSLWKSSFVAALFALHPMHVESVAWVAERKDVLSAFFWFSTLLLYSEYVVKGKPVLYALTLFCFILGLMSKPMLVTLPIVMLLMDLWPLERYRSQEQEQGVPQRPCRVIALVREKIPFFACALFSAVITIYAQYMGGATSNLVAVPILLRLENSLVAYVKYLILTLWPHDLAILYPMTDGLPLWQVIGSLFVVLSLSVVAIRVRVRRPSFTVGWFWFLVTLVPVIGLIQVGAQSMADRYSYIPSIGLFIMVAWGAPALTKELRHGKGILVLISGAIIITCAALSWQQLGYWRDSISLFRHTLKVTTNNSIANNNLGVALAKQGEHDAAIEQYHAALRLNPNYVRAHNNLGISLVKKGDLDQAIREYGEALRIDPNFADAHGNLGVALAQAGDLNAAMLQYREALQINPNFADAHSNMGLLLAGKGEVDAAIHEYQEAIRINPNYADPHSNLGLALADKGDLDAAIREYHEALRIDPDLADAHNNLGVALTKSDMDRAIREFQTALRLNPTHQLAQNNLRHALALKR